jgi:hypothetical protein
MDNSEIVEIYSAANSFEAHALANALIEAGIKARVVGDFLGAAAGGLAVGAPISPRIWVMKDEEIRALELLEQWKAELNKSSDSAETEE